MSGIEVRIDYGAISRNVEVLRQAADGTDVLAVVKADGYGHGLVESARAARVGGAAWLGVAQPSEAIALREAGDDGRILVWLYGPEEPVGGLIAGGVDLSASSVEMVRALAAASSEAGSPARLHLCVDTGLGREGVTAADLPEVLREIREARDAGDVEPVGIWSHFAWADAPGHATTNLQRENFEQAVEVATAEGVEFPIRHLANSAATLTRPDVRYELVRPGLAIYGHAPIADPAGANFGLIPAMTVQSSLVLVKAVGKGQGVSYGHEYVTDRETVLGLVSAGYADGVFRSAGNRGRVRVGNELVPIVGRVCMDQFVVDLGPGTAARVGDAVTLIGPEGPTAQDWAQAAGTIDYEVLVRFGASRPKVVA